MMHRMSGWTQLAEKITTSRIYQQAGQLPQTDRASAFVGEPPKTFLTSSSITMQNLVLVSLTVCAHVPNILGRLIPRNMLLPYMC